MKNKKTKIVNENWNIKGGNLDNTIINMNKDQSKKIRKDEKKSLELGLLLDCTFSMDRWIERAKVTLQ